MAIQGIIIPNWHPAPLNKLLGGHWSKGAKFKSTDRAIVAAYAKPFAKAQGKRRVTLRIVLGKGERACDPDAFWKSLLDALVQCGMLVDDNRQNVELMPVRFDRGARRSEIMLEDLE